MSKQIRKIKTSESLDWVYSNIFLWYSTTFLSIWSVLIYRYLPKTPLKDLPKTKSLMLLDQGFILDHNIINRTHLMHWRRIKIPITCSSSLNGKHGVCSWGCFSWFFVFFFFFPWVNYFCNFIFFFL